MLSLNRVILAGYAGQDAVLKYLNNGMPMARFRLATTETYASPDGKFLNSTDWHTIVAWRNLAQMVEKEVKKGCGVYVEGKIKTRRWFDNSGTEHTITEIYADTVTVVSQPKPQQTETKVENIGDVFNNNINDLPSDLPTFDDGLPF